MRYMIKDSDTGEVLVDSKLEQYYVRYTRASGTDEASIYVSKKKEKYY